MSYDFLTINFFPVVGMIFLLVFLLSNPILEKSVRLKFYRLIIFVQMELILYDLELLLPSLHCSPQTMTLVTALGYSIRPVLLYFLIGLILRKDKRKGVRLLLAIPGLIGMGVSFTAFFTDVAYYYDDNLVFHRGILGWTPHLVMLSYLVMMIVLSFVRKGKNHFEQFIIVEISVILSLAAFAESLLNSYAVLRIAIMCSVIFYYMFFQTKIYQSDIIGRQKEKIAMSEHFNLQMVAALAGTVDAKDSYTKGHSRRVAEYAREIAKRLGKDEKFRKRIYYMGMLHDVGKIGIPDTIIKKSGKLTEEEYNIIKSHPSIGSDVLANISDMPQLYCGARWHHERFDGSGYPDGLKGRDIPLEARIIAVADAYDAMTSRRSYRDALPQEQVRQEMVMGKGTQFDPQIADIMVSMIDEDVNYSMKEA